jgi:hypothetical protein
MQAHDASAEVGLFLYEDDAMADFGGLHRRRHPRNAPSDYENGLCISVHESVSRYIL